MMSSLATSSPVSASTLRYLIRWPVLRLIWLNETFSVSEVAGKSATGQVTSDRRRKPFQLAQGAIAKLRFGRLGFKTFGCGRFRHPAASDADSSLMGWARPGEFALCALIRRDEKGNVGQSWGRPPTLIVPLIHQITSRTPRVGKFVP